MRKWLDRISVFLTIAGIGTILLVAITIAALEMSFFGKCNKLKSFSNNLGFENNRPKPMLLAVFNV